jgi:hypothetical protein
VYTIEVADNAGNQPAERTSMKEKTENATKFLQAVARMRESGIVVADKTRKGGGMGLARRAAALLRMARAV